VVLLDAGLGPATEVRPVAPGGRVIPIAPPEVEALPAIPVAHKSGPLMLVGVDTTELGAKDALGGVGKIVHERTVLGSAAEPVLGTLDIEPHLTVLDVLGVIIESLDLMLGVTALGAREHVDIDVLHATRPGIADTLSAMLVRIASAAIATDDGKIVALIVKALPRAHTEELGNINTLSGAGCNKACSNNS